MKKNNSGMSLVEVVIAMAIIGIVSLLVYRGISAGVNIISRGSKLMQDSTAACAAIEENIATKTNPVAGSITATIESASGSAQSVSISSYGYREEFEVGKETVYITFFDNQRDPFVPTDEPENPEEGEGTEGGEGDNTEGGEGDNTEGSEGDNTEGGEGDNTEGGEGDNTEGSEGDNTEGGEGDNTEGSEGENTEGNEGENAEGSEDENTEGSEGENAEG